MPCAHTHTGLVRTSLRSGGIRINEAAVPSVGAAHPSGMSDDDDNEILQFNGVRSKPESRMRDEDSDDDTPLFPQVDSCKCCS